MAPRIIYVTYLNTVLDVLSLIRQWSGHEQVPHLRFDFSQIHFSKTIAALLFARELRNLVKCRKELGLYTDSSGVDVPFSSALGYLSFIGYFDFVGLPQIGKPVRHDIEDVGGKTYIPITCYNYKRFQVYAEYDQFRTEYEYIRQEADKIASLLLRSSTNAKNTVLAYAICEILRNAYEHSQSPEFWIAGQYWPREGAVEFVIMDEGVGLLKTLSNKYPFLASENDAILEAMKPGVSRQDFKGKNKYSNSGFGLYVLTEFARRHGQICIASNDCLLRRSSYAPPSKDAVCRSGTFVGIRLNEIPDDSHDELTKIINEGNELSGQGAYPVHPSANTWNF